MMLRSFIAGIGLVLFASAAAVAQNASGVGASSSGSSTMSSDQRVGGTAKAAHRQPRRSDSDSSDPFRRDPADVELDRKIRSICRGC